MTERNQDGIDLLQNQEAPNSTNRLKQVAVLLAGIGIAAIIGAGSVYHPEATKIAAATVAFGLSLVAIGGITAVNRD